MPDRLPLSWRGMAKESGDADDWFLTPAERANSSTTVDRLAEPGRAWIAGNRVSVLVHGSSYFADLLNRVRSMAAHDMLFFTDWRGDPDERLDGPGTEVGEVFASAAARGVVVRGLIWRSHLDRFRFSAAENRHLGESINRAGGECLLDSRVRPGGSHHQKLVVLRHPGRPHLDVAYVGGIDLCHSRRDDGEHHGDPQRQAMATVYGDRPPWHDVQVMVEGPAVGAAETVFRERWEDPQRPTRNPIRRAVDHYRGDDDSPTPLPPQLEPPAVIGNHRVQLLRTYPYRRRGYSFAPRGEFSVAAGYAKALRRARGLIYVEDQYLWSRDVATTFAEALSQHQHLRVIAVVPRFPDQDGRISLPPNLVGRAQAMAVLRKAGGDRVAVYAPENEAGVPVYVHAKVCIVDDTWVSVGSDNFNRRSWTHDSELAVAVLDRDFDDRSVGFDRASGFARSLRLRLAAEHLGRPHGDCEDLIEPTSAFEAFVRSADELDRWHQSGKTTSRPPGRLRPVQDQELPAFTRAWATPLYRVLYDPDGRPRRSRTANESR
ncbi:MAG: phosphatidylserine/phosphatidylglycerophosphate/cardiolipinsynthase-like protein [Acidimicrobiia bacterium]|nr:phosphatidylserine/phosphatidylglycerophosphate/cardiolipinsynthase-like protein [Acidimicrobiia bacterium]